MFKKTSKILSVVIILSVILSSCSLTGTTEGGAVSSDPTQTSPPEATSNDPEATSNEPETEPPVTEPMETWGSPMTLPEPAVEDLINDDRYFIKLDQYLDILSGYIHEEYRAGQTLDFSRLHEMIIRCCVANRALSNASFNEEYGSVTISKNEVLRVGRLLLGCDIPLSDELEDPIGQTYATSYIEQPYRCAGSSYMSVVTNTDELLVIDSDLLCIKDLKYIISRTRMEYTFKKVYVDGMIVLQLQSIEKI